MNKNENSIIELEICVVYFTKYIWYPGLVRVFLEWETKAVFRNAQNSCSINIVLFFKVFLTYFW